jgi:hypothetical protein
LQFGDELLRGLSGVFEFLDFSKGIAEGSVTGTLAGVSGIAPRCGSDGRANAERELAGWQR